MVNELKKISPFMFIFLCIISCSSNKNVTKKEINVLFIGNSLTYFFEMPITLQKMIDETNPNIKIDQITSAGTSLSQHMGINSKFTQEDFNNYVPVTRTAMKIKEKKWDYIILQTGTVAVLIPENVEYKVERAIDLIKKNTINPSCEFILYNTWPSKKEYPKKYCYDSYYINSEIEKNSCCSEEINNLEEELKLINDSYTNIAKKKNLIKSDNGNIAYQIIINYPEIELYKDKIHPSEYGSFLNACIFYQMITNNKASSLKYTGQLDEQKANIIKKVVSQN